MITRDWGHVTIAEYAALNILLRDDAESRMDAYWDSIHAFDLCAGPTPTRLNDSGREWLESTRTACQDATDEAVLIDAAREFVKSFGTMLTMNVHRNLKESVSNV